MSSRGLVAAEVASHEGHGGACRHRHDGDLWSRRHFPMAPGAGGVRSGSFFR